MYRRLTQLMLAAAAILASASCYRTKLTPEHVPAHAVAVFPPEIDLGKRERGEVAVASFTVANRSETE